MRIVAEGLQFPEGPVWMEDGSIILVEIGRETLSRIRPDGRVEVVANVPGGPNGAALAPDGRVVICNNGGVTWVREPHGMRPKGQSPSYRGGSIDIVTLATGKVERLYDRCGENALNGPNDLVFDRHGGFYFTDMGKRRDRDMDRGFVYWARSDGSEIRELASLMTTPNGIGLSPDGGTLYVAETDTARLWAFDILAPGQLAKAPWPSPNGGRLVLGLPGYRRFDSLAVTASGRICVAALESMAIVETDATGSEHREHAVPDLAVSNLCFGGANLTTAFVTLSYAGKLAAIPWHEPGLPL
jgi:gluconolactonase